MPMGRAAILLVLALACAAPQPAEPIRDATLRYDGTAYLNGWGEAYSVRAEVRAIPGRAVRADVFVTPLPFMLNTDFPFAAALAYGALETPDECRLRAWIPNCPAGVSDFVVPYLNMRCARKDVPHPLLMPAEAPLRLAFEPVPVTAAFWPDLVGTSSERAWSDVTVPDTLARALPVRTLTKTIGPSRIFLRASVTSSTVVAITYEARTFTTRDLKEGPTIPAAMRLQWEVVDITGGRTVLLSTRLRLSGDPELNTGLTLEDLQRGFDAAPADAVLKAPGDYEPGCNRALATAKSNLVAAARNRAEPAPAGRDALRKAFEGAKDAAPSTAAAFASLCDPNSFDGDFAKKIVAAESAQPFALPEATLALAAALKKEDAARVLNRGLAMETSLGWQRHFRAALVASDPASLETHLGALDGFDAVAHFADLTLLDIADDDDAALALKRWAAENSKDPAAAPMVSRIAAWRRDPEDVVDACALLTEPAALDGSIDFVHVVADSVIRGKDEALMKAIAPGLKEIAKKAAAALPGDPRPTLLLIDAAKLEGADSAEAARSLFEPLEKALANRGWDATLSEALGEACRASAGDAVLLERGVKILAAAADQTPGSTGVITKDASRNPVLLLAAAAPNGKAFFRMLDAPGLRLKGFDFQFWDIVTKSAKPEVFRDRAIEALAAGDLSARACRLLAESRSGSAMLFDWGAILDKATQVYPKDAALWTLRGRIAGLDAYRKALDLDATNVEAAVAVAESVKPDEAAKLLDALTVSDDARPFITRMSKIYEAAGQADGAKKWKALIGEE